MEFPRFTGLKSDTEYRVEASFDSNFDSGVQFKLFTTKRPTVLSVEIDENSIEQAGATAIVRIHEPNGESQTVHLRYRPATQTDWSTNASDAGYIPYPTALDAVSIPIAGSEIGHGVRGGGVTGKRLQPVCYDDIHYGGPQPDRPYHQRSNAAERKGDYRHRGTEWSVLCRYYVRYRKVTDPVNELWAYVDTSSTDATAEASLLNLTSGTVYEAQASLE